MNNQQFYIAWHKENTPLTELGDRLSTRSRNALERDGIDTVEKLLAMPTSVYEMMRGVGRKCLREISFIRTFIHPKPKPDLKLETEKRLLIGCIARLVSATEAMHEFYDPDNFTGDSGDKITLLLRALYDASSDAQSIISQIYYDRNDS